MRLGLLAMSGVRVIDPQLAWLGVTKALERAGVKPGDKVRCGNFEWEWP